MNLLFLTLVDITSIENHGIYEDLLREFARHGHQVYVVSPTERRNGQRTRIIREEKATILKVRTGNVQKTNLIEKGLSTLSLESLLIRAIKRYLKDVHFELLLYSTPPITWARIVLYFKRRDGARSYLLLKDIFPQNAVDLGMMKEGGLLHRYFRAKEKKLYAVSDRIGCTSPANDEYVLKHNPSVSKSKIARVANSVDPQLHNITPEERYLICDKYHIPNDKTVFFYGGNLGAPQDIPFIIQCLRENARKLDRFFILCGQGTSYQLLKNYFNQCSPKNSILLPCLPKEEFDKLVLASDIGLIFLDHRFTVPNCPARFYTYLECAKPVFACTDVATDIRLDILNGDFGWWCESTDARNFTSVIDIICGLGKESLKLKGQLARKYLEKNYTVTDDYVRIIESIEAAFPRNHPDKSYG